MFPFINVLFSDASARLPFSGFLLLLFFFQRPVPCSYMLLLPRVAGAKKLRRFNDVLFRSQMLPILADTYLQASMVL